MWIWLQVQLKVQQRHIMKYDDVFARSELQGHLKCSEQHLGSCGCIWLIVSCLVLIFLSALGRLGLSFFSVIADITDAETCSQASLHICLSFIDSLYWSQVKFSHSFLPDSFFSTCAVTWHWRSLVFMCTPFDYESWWPMWKVETPTLQQYCFICFLQPLKQH